MTHHLIHQEEGSGVLRAMFQKKFGRARTWRIFVGLVCCVDVFTVCRCYHVPKVRRWSAKKRGAFVLNNIIYVLRTSMYSGVLILYQIFVSLLLKSAERREWDRLLTTDYCRILRLGTPHWPSMHPSFRPRRRRIFRDLKLGMAYSMDK